MLRARHIPLVPVFLAALALAACGPAKSADENLDSLDAELTNSTAADQPARDPALMSALQSQIMVDPALAQQANQDALKPADQPYSAPVPADAVAAAPAGAPPVQTGPLIKAPAPKADCPGCDTARQAVTLGGLAARQKAPRTAECVGGMRYSNNWATRLPDDVPLYPGARLTEAAGNARGGCALRAVSFTTGAALQSVIDWYYTRTTQAGYQSEHQADAGDHVLGGNRNRDDAAFILFASPGEGGGTEVELIVNNGR